MPVTLTASNTPAPVVPGTTIYRSDAYAGTSAPPTSQQQTAGSLAPLAAAKLNQNAAAQDINTRYGAGGYGVGAGLVVSAGSGLTVSVSAGQAIIDGLVDHKTAQTVVVPPSSSRAYIWLMADGTFTVQNATTAKPSGNCVFLGSCVTSDVAVTSVDSSGVVTWQSGQLWRETADTGRPGDSPNAALRIWTKTSGGIYFWDGAAHRKLQDGGLLSKDVAGNVDVTLTAAEAQNDVILLTGALTGNISVVLPVVAGAKWIVQNGTSGAFTLTVKHSGETGFAITQGKRALMFSDGTDVRLVVESA